MTEVVLIGASGWFGGHIRDRMRDLITVPAQAVLASGGEVLRPLLDGADRAIVNAAGARTGTPDTLQRLNVDLPDILAQQVARLGGHLVHLGSAAEYGTAQPGGTCAEDAVPAPESDYGRTKLAGSLRVLDQGRATVLRIFNVAACPPQPGSPLADIAERVRSAIASGTDVELLSAGTVRDWVRLAYVCDSIAYAARQRPTGVFNICSGVGVQMGDAVRTAVALLGSPAGVRDLEVFPPTAVVGSPDLWSETSQMSEPLTVGGLAAILQAAVTGCATDDSDGGGGAGGRLGARS